MTCSDFVNALKMLIRSEKILFLELTKAMPKKKVIDRCSTIYIWKFMSGTFSANYDL